MNTATILVHGIVINDQKLRVDDSKLVSRVLFDVIVGDMRYANCYCSVTQPVGADYDNDPVEVGPPEGYPNTAPWGLREFSDQIERYYRNLIGRNGRAMSIGPGAKDI